ncbi:MAG: LytTR family DNA-binding domain-containing protein [Firmicutes bacterium]|nr:LytTR family DNA-binding domain-containing protein [Bacillota bacterium]
MTLRIAICDDEQKQIEYLTVLVSSWGSQNGHTITIDSFPSAEAFLFDYAEDQNRDILLLDIEMGAMNGVELAKTIRQTNDAVQIVFITGFPDFIAEGYEVSALHYLMKPVSEEKLHAILDKAAANLNKAEKRLRVAFDRQVDYVPLSRITHVEAQKQYVVIYTEAETYRMKSSLAEAEKLLDEYFFKCQRSFIVNLRYVKRIKGDCVVLKNEEEVPISRGMAEKIGKEIIRLF